MRGREADREATPGSQGTQGTQGRLSRVTRMLTDSLLLGRPARRPDPAAARTPARAARAFAVPLRDQALTKEGVPAVVAKICSYLENNGLQCGSLFQQGSGNARLAARLRSTLDLERAGDVFTTALLLKQWLKELPEPVISGPVVTELLTTHRKLREEPVETWRQSVRLLLCTLPELNLRLLRYLLRFLDRYCHHQQQQHAVPALPALPQLAAVFSPLLVLKGLEYFGPDQSSLATDLTSRLIQDHAAIFHQWVLDHPRSSAAGGKHNLSANPRKAVADIQNTSHQQRKRKERNESANSNQSLERKVIRSSSEERHIEVSKADSKTESIRRVSSHEDFSHTKQQLKLSGLGNRFTTVVEISDQSRALVFGGLPLQECNHIDTNQQPRDLHAQLAQLAQPHSLQEKENEVRDEEDEHERRRSSERVCRSGAMGRRTPTRRRRPQPQGADVSPARSIAALKENEDVNKSGTAHLARPSTLIQHSLELPRAELVSPVEDGLDDVEVDSLSDESRPESSHSFLQLHPPERERSPSPSISPCTPPLDLSTLHQSVDGSEPVSSRVGWEFSQQPHHEGEDNGRGVLLSPRNSTILTRRVYTDHNVPPSPPGDHHGSCLPGPAVDVENIIKKFHKQISSVKKKLKRYEEGFEREFGYRPSQSDKMANKDIKRLYGELSFLRKELKQLKENPLPAVVSQTEPSALRLGLSAPNDESVGPSTVSITDTVADVERRLREKRRTASRPESLDEMTAEQHAAEKLALQKSLLLLEKLCGRASSKQDREIVRPLYDRYRLLKRIVARAASSKLKDSINELATIHEHEAMEFTTSSSLLALTDGGVELQPQISAYSSSASPSGVGAQPQQSVEETSDSQTSSSDSLGENLHSLPLSDLVLQLTQTREEKKRLRRVLREQEEQFQRQTGRRMQREDRMIVGSDSSQGEGAGVYSAYKQVKAKLRLLEALVAKLSKC